MSELLLALAPSIVTLLVAMLVNVGAWVLVGAQRRKYEADAAGTLTGAAIDIVKSVQEQVEILEAQVTALKLKDEARSVVLDTHQAKLASQVERLREVVKLNHALLTGNALLTTQVRELGQVPVWNVAMVALADPDLREELARLTELL